MLVPRACARHAGRLVYSELIALEIECIEHLRRLREAGLGVGLDDFGQGYAGFSHLQSLPLNRLKIDRSLIAQLSNSHDDSPIVSSTIILAKRLGFTGALGTVAEVEDGKFTGRLVGDILHGPGKKHAVAALAALHRIFPGVRFLGSYPRAEHRPVAVRRHTSDDAYRAGRAWVDGLLAR